MPKSNSILSKEEKRRMHSIVKTIRWRLWSFDKRISNHVFPDAVEFEIGLLPYLHQLKDICYAAQARADVRSPMISIVAEIEQDGGMGAT
jgi:hypothetical protein